MSADQQTAELANELISALIWALPLAEIALEDHRQTRLQNGHDDIGRGTKVLGLWPSEVEQRDKARAILAKATTMGAPMSAGKWMPIETSPRPQPGKWFLICGQWLGEPIVRETDGVIDSALWKNIRPTLWRRMPYPPTAGAKGDAHE